MKKRKIKLMRMSGGREEMARNLRMLEPLLTHSVIRVLRRKTRLSNRLAAPQKKLKTLL